MKLNVTGLTAAAQVELVAGCLAEGERAIVSVFAGRIADCGVDPVPVKLGDAGAAHRGGGILWLEQLRARLRSTRHRMTGG